ncbi:MAG TPA: NfeD family protein [Anaerolineales bacterium]|nr:NfeD family protein [Anaerolineales bacterium]
MDILLNPNVAFLFLLGGFLLGMLALATPGTGFFEISAIFCIALAGYAVYNLSINLWALILLVLSLFFFIYAIQKPKRELYLGVSIFLLVIGSVFLFPREGGFGIAVSPIVAIVASTLVAGFLWIAARKSIEAIYSRPAHDLNTLIGQVGEARTDIHDEGSAQVGMELWSARSEDPILMGTPVRVVRREGFYIIVEKANKSN